MPTFRCDFEVIGDLVLSSSTQEGEITCSNDSTFTFQNAYSAKSNYPPEIIAHVVGHSESIDTTMNENHAQARSQGGSMSRHGQKNIRG
jgi:hypothetical protein